MSHNGRHTISIRDKVWCCCCYCLRQLTKLLQRQFKMDRALCVNRSFLLSLMPLRSGTWSQWDINRGRQGNLEAFSFSIQGLMPYFIFCIFSIELSLPFFTFFIFWRSKQTLNPNLKALYFLPDSETVLCCHSVVFDLSLECNIHEPLYENNYLVL